MPTHIVVSQYTAERRDCAEAFFSSLSSKVRIGYSMLTYILFTAFFCSLNFPISVHFNGCQEDFLTSHGVVLNDGNYEGYSDRKDLGYILVLPLASCCLANTGSEKVTLRLRIS